LVKDRLETENPENIKILEELDANSVIIVAGSADHIEQVFAATKMPHNVVTPDQLTKLNLKKDQTVYINCHTTGYPNNFHNVIEQFVKSGGQLITTDWSLNTVLTQCFPGFVEWDNQSTSDGVVTIELDKNDTDEVLQGFKDEKIWWLAGGSHPITVVNKEKVTILVKSGQMNTLFPGCGAILIKFNYGEGVVYHMISHFHLQHKSTRPANTPSAVQNTTAGDYVKSKGGKAKTLETQEKYEADYGRAFDYAEVQNATTQSEFCTRSVINQKKKWANK